MFAFVCRWQKLRKAELEVERDMQDAQLEKLTTQEREIRKKMFEIMTREATSCDLKELVQKFVPEAIGREIEKATRSIYPLQNVYVHKAKILKSPKLDIGKLLELHGESTDVRLVLAFALAC